MNYNHLHAFCRLAQTLHYAKAAEEMGIAQPSLSRMIAQLERNLGIPLFEKHGRGIALTRQGAVLAEHASNGFSQIDLGVQSAGELIHPGCGIISLAYIYALSYSYIPEQIRKFTELPENRQIRFHFYQGSSADVVQNIRDKNCEFGFCSWLPDEPDMEFLPVISQEYVLMVSNRHPLAGKKSVTLSEAASCDFILSTDRARYVENLFEQAGLSPRIVSRVQEDHAAAAMAAINLGVSIIPFNHFLEQYPIRLIPFGPRPLLRTFCLVTPKDRFLSPAAQRFCRFASAKKSETFPQKPGDS